MLDDVSRSPRAKHVTAVRLIKDDNAGKGLFWDRDAYNAIIPTLPVIQRLRDIILRFANCSCFRVNMSREDDWTVSPRRDLIASSDVLGLAFILIAETGLPLEILDIHCRRRGRRDARLRLDVDLIHTELFNTPTFKTALSHLKELSLYLVIDRNLSPYVWPMDLLSLPARLEKFEWNLSIRTDGSPFDFELPCLPYLRDIAIGDLSISTANLVKFLIGCRDNLRSVKLSQLMMDRECRSIFQALQSFEKLESISFHYLRLISTPWPGTFPGLDDTVEIPGTLGRKLQLKRRRVPEPVSVTGVDYSGPGIRSVVATLAKFYDPSGRASP